VLPGSCVVFELANEPAREFYVGWTKRPIEEFVSRLRMKPPPEIAHWDFASRIHVRAVESGLTQASAEEFLPLYIETLARVGWRVLRARVRHGEAALDEG
jgi:hypothetical protein